MNGHKSQAKEPVKERTDMELIKVKRNYQLTIPSILRRKLKLSVGDYLEADVEGDRIVIRPVEVTRPGAKASRSRATEEAYAVLDEIWAKLEGDDPDAVEALVSEAVKAVRKI